jgi:integrase
VSPGFHDLIFTNLQGGPLDGTFATRAFQRRLRAAGLPRQWFHDLRHGTATLLLAQGVPMKVVSEKLGHAQFGITMNPTQRSESPGTTWSRGLVFLRT